MAQPSEDSACELKHTAEYVCIYKQILLESLIRKDKPLNELYTSGIEFKPNEVQ